LFANLSRFWPVIERSDWHPVLSFWGDNLGHRFLQSVFTLFAYSNNAP